MELRAKQLEQKLRKRELQDTVTGGASNDQDDQILNSDTLDEELKK